MELLEDKNYLFLLLIRSDLLKVFFKIRKDTFFMDTGIASKVLLSLKFLVQSN